MTGEAPSQIRTARVAVVGAGPAGFYTTDFLLRQRAINNLRFEVDLFERLPSPHGLVRSGVAPDHQSIKKVTKAFDRIASQPGVRFFGNVDVGSDISHDELMEHYSYVVYTTGAPTDRQLGIPGEELPGSHAATTFVGWYNGHPDFAGASFDLSVKRAVVVGLGNVAIDVARILIQDPSDLRSTDIAGYALQALEASHVREVVLLGRRGPAEAAFSPREIRDIDELEGVELRVDDPASTLALSPDNYQGDAQKNLQFLQEVARRPASEAKRRVRLKFLCSPVEITGDARVQQLKVEHNELCTSASGRVSARGTGRFEVLDTGLVFRSIGYRGTALPGLPFDSEWGVIPNQLGRVTEKRDGVQIPRLYTAGWIKRGPTGLIGTNKTCAKETVDQLLADAEKGEPPSAAPEAVSALLKRRNVRVVSNSDWRIIDEIELANGKASGKVREKFYSTEAMLNAIRSGEG